MILTNKTKKDFLRYYGTSAEYFTITLKEIEQLANITEWLDSIGLWEKEFYEVYIESTPTTEFKQIIERTIINLNKKYNEENR